MIGHIVETLQQTQYTWTTMQEQLHSRIRLTEGQLRRKAEIESHNYLIYEQVAQLAE
jgi:hypothetical protein